MPLVLTDFYLGGQRSRDSLNVFNGAVKKNIIEGGALPENSKSLSKNMALEWRDDENG